jgi:two-component system sensor histidine kinase/response regulator
VGSDHSSSSARILLAEDNPQDIFLLKEAFLNEHLNIEIDCVGNGDELLDRLQSFIAGRAVLPGLLLLDAHLPRRNAEEVLAVLHADNTVLPFPIVVLTTLISDQERIRLLGLGVREVLSKPLDLNEYYVLAQHLNSMLNKGAST